MKPPAHDPARDRSGPDAALERELAALRADYDALKDEKVRTEQNLANVRQQLEELQARAVAEYGTADVERLAALLADKRAENTRLVEEYRAHIRGIQEGLKALDGQEAVG